MGLTIHYSGRINPEASLDILIGECLEFANVFHWKYLIFEDGLKHSKPNEGESLQQMIERIAGAIHSDYRKRKF